MDDHANAEAAWPPPYPVGPGERLWVYFTEGPEPIPLGVYRQPSQTVGVESIEVPPDKLARVLRDITAAIKRLEDAVPGAGDLIELLLAPR